MKKDIFIDDNIACRFTNPMDPHLKALIAWLNENPPIAKGAADARAYLVVSKKLLAEYNRSCISPDTKYVNAIPFLVSRLQREGRIRFISNKQIKTFQKSHYVKGIVRHLQSNNEDREHIPVVLLSDRKYALTNDSNFKHDLKIFPGYNVLVSDRPEQIPYR